MTHLKRKLMMTLALLITAATGAWATDYTTLAVGDVIKVGDKFSPTADGAINDNGVESGYIYKLIRADVDNDYYVTEETDGAYYVFEYAAGEFRYIHFEKAFTVTPISDGLVVTNIETEKGKQSYTLALHEPAPAATPFAITWSAATPNTASIDKMPAGNVTVSVDYFPQAAFAMSTDPTPVPLAPTAIADVPANTDDPIVKAGTVANIGTSEVKQGTLMYFVKQPTDNTVPDAPDYNTDGWSEDVPTANELKQGDVYVWYYIKGAEPANIADRTDDNTRSDSDIMPLGTSGVVTLAAEPTYDVSLNKTGLAEGEPAKWSAKSTNVTTEVVLGTGDLKGVKKGETVTVTYSGSKKVLGVKAEKKASGTPLTTPLTIEAITPGTIVVNIDGTLLPGMKYSVNGGTKTFIETTTPIEGLKAGDKVQFYGNGTDTQIYGGNPGVKIQGSGDGFKTKVYGNIMSLLDEEGFATKTDLPNYNYVFYGLFKENTTLIDASELLLPAATLTGNCYQLMFAGCTSLTTAPKLPATTLAVQCYYRMFKGCTSLTSAYVKAAFIVENLEYAEMFNGCTATGAVLHTTLDSKASWEAMMGTDKDWSNWTVADDWKD